MCRQAETVGSYQKIKKRGKLRCVTADQLQDSEGQGRCSTDSLQGLRLEVRAGETGVCSSLTSSRFCAPHSEESSAIREGYVFERSKNIMKRKL